MNIFHEFICDFIEFFIVDFTLFGKKQNHVGHLALTLQRCHKVGFKIHPGKCFFGVQEYVLLGHKVSSHDIEVDQEKNDNLVSSQVPWHLEEIMGFPGMFELLSMVHKRFFEHCAILDQYVEAQCGGQVLSKSQRKLWIIKETLSASANPGYAWLREGVFGLCQCIWLLHRRGPEPTRWQWTQSSHLLCEWFARFNWEELLPNRLRGTWNHLRNQEILSSFVGV